MPASTLAVAKLHADDVCTFGAPCSPPASFRGGLGDVRCFEAASVAAAFAKLAPESHSQLPEGYAEGEETGQIPA